MVKAINPSSPISVKCFLGIVQTGEVKLYLSQNKIWKKAKLFQDQTLVETQFQDREYIGKFIDSPLSYDQLKQIEQEIKKHLKLYCPKLDVDKQVFFLFSQLFLS